jgi:hypothetical protein
VIRRPVEELQRLRRECGRIAPVVTKRSRPTPCRSEGWTGVSDPRGMLAGQDDQRAMVRSAAGGRQIRGLAGPCPVLDCLVPPHDRTHLGWPPGSPGWSSLEARIDTGGRDTERPAAATIKPDCARTADVVAVGPSPATSDRQMCAPGSDCARRETADVRATSGGCARRRPDVRMESDHDRSVGPQMCAAGRTAPAGRTADVRADLGRSAPRGPQMCAPAR